MTASDRNVNRCPECGSWRTRGRPCSICTSTQEASPMPVTANSRTMIVRVDELEPHDRVAHGAVLGPFQVTADAVVHSVRPGQFNKLGVKFYNIGVIYLHPATLVEVER